MKKIIIVFIFLLASVVKVYFNKLTTSKPNADAVSHSISEAMRSGVYIKSLTPKPNYFFHKGVKIPIKEAWIEKASDYDFFMVWFSYRRKKDGYKLVVKPNEAEFFLGYMSIDSEVSSFTTVGGGFLFYEDLLTMPNEPIKISYREKFRGIRPPQHLTLGFK